MTPTYNLLVTLVLELGKSRMGPAVEELLQYKKQYHVSYVFP